MKQRIFTTIKEPSVIARVIKRTPFEALSSDGTLAAAVMVAAALCAVIVANTPLYTSVHYAFTQSLGIWIANFYVSMTFEAFINDFLMAIFFLLVGIELKYEMVVGQLRRLVRLFYLCLQRLGECASRRLSIQLLTGEKASTDGQFLLLPILHLPLVLCRFWVSAWLLRLKSFSKHLLLPMTYWQL